MVLVLTAFSQLLTDFGLSDCLIKKKDATPLDFSSCFWFSSVIDVAIMFLMMYTSESISNLYGREELTNICLCLSVIFLSNSISSTPKAVLTKSLKYNTLLIGDSHANHWYEAFEMSMSENQTLSRATASACRPVVPLRGAKRCTELIKWVIEDLLKTHHFDLVILSARWSHGGYENIPNIVSKIKKLLTE